MQARRVKDVTQAAIIMSEDHEGSRLLATDFRSLSLFRIVFSVYLLVDFFFVSAPYFGDFYTDSGFVPLSSLEANRSIAGMPVVYPLLVLLESIRLPAVLPFLYPAALIGFALGFRTRWSNGIALLLFSYLYWRNPYIRSGAESLAHLLLLWCLFVPMSRYWSVDAALDPQPRNRAHPVLPFIAIKLQVCSLYFFAALFKLGGAPWRSGYAIAWALSDNAFGGTPTGLYLVQNVPAILTLATYTVMALQLAFPLLVFSPWRNDVTRALALGGVALMHISFMFALNIGGFPFLCLAMLLLLVPDAWLDQLFQRRRKRLERVSIYYEPDCGFCQKIALVLREFLLPPSTPVLPASANPEALRLLREHNSWVVRSAHGNMHFKWRAIAYILSESPLLKPLAWLMDVGPLRRLFERLYDLIGRNRRRLGPLTALVLKFRSESAPGLRALAVCGLLTLLALVGNIHHALRPSYSSPTSLDHLVAGLQVGQRWNLFAPIPAHSRHSYEISAHTTDGSAFDLLAVSPTPFLRIRGDNGLEFPNHRWLKYFNRFDTLSEGERLALGRYLCRLARAECPTTVEIRNVVFTKTRTASMGHSSASPPRSKTHAFDCVPMQH